MILRVCICFLAFFTLAACGDTNVAETQECNAGDKRCTADGSVETCNDTGQFMFSEQCAIDEQCSAGECVDPPPPEACTTDDECLSNGSNACLVSLCDNGTCKETIRDEPGCCDPDLDVPCGGMEDPCTTDACVDFNCILTTVENCCTEVTECIVKDCQTVVECDDNNTCIYDSNCCANDSECDDNNACTDDTCENKDCVNTAIVDCCANDNECDDNNACTDDTCENQDCVNTAIVDCCANDNECDDNSECTDDSCTANQCVNTPTSGPACCDTSNQSCDDNNPCTLDVCLPNNKCEYSNVDKCCNYESPLKGKCQDSNECTLDTCNPDNTCTNPNKPNGTPCTGSKQCNNGKCEIPKAPDQKDDPVPSG